MIFLLPQVFVLVHSDMVLVFFCSTLYDHCSLFCFFFFFFFLFLEFALHSIHAFHSRIFFFKLKKKRGSKMCFALFSWIWNQGRPIYFYITCLCTLFNLDELIYCTLLVEALQCMLCGKMFIVFDHMILILKSHAFDCRTWTYWERH